MKISRGIFCQDIVDDERPRVGSKKSVQQGRLLPGSSRRATPLFCARSVLVLRERSRRGERQVCEPEGPENSENAADGFFQQTHKDSDV